MKILIIHTFYAEKGGEDTVALQEQALLKSEGEVKLITFQNQSGWRGAVMFLFSIWNIYAGAKIKKEIINFKPDIVHIHNWHFASGPLIIRIAHNAKVPVVLTLHNYRLLCPSAILLHKGILFTESISTPFPWKAIFFKVYRNSFFQTFWLAFIIWFHKKVGTWGKVSRYIVLTEFSKELFVNSSFNISPQQFVVKSNFVPSSKSVAIKREQHFLYMGRLSEEKGITVLLEAFAKTGYPIRIAGEGPLKETVKKYAAKHSNIKYRNQLSRDEVFIEMKKCSALVFPSIWFEGMPMTILEAFSVGTPVISSDLGAMKSMIKHEWNGLLFKPNNPDSLCRSLHFWVNLSIEEKQQYYLNSEREYKEHYTPVVSIKQLLKIYKAVIEERNVLKK